MHYVCVVDTDRKPLRPVHPGRARLLLTQGKAAVLKRYPFTLVLKTRVQEQQQPALRLKLDPGSRTTGIAIVDDQAGQVLFAAELVHRGAAIKKAIDERRSVRHARRARHTRYHPARFRNRRRPAGWLAPSLRSRVQQIETWIRRLCAVCPIGALSMELVRFDLQALEQPGIEGCQYQQGTLAGYEVREYLLQKWERRCSYCGKQGVPLQVEHIVARANGGTNRISNLCLACEPCNREKGTQDIRVFLARKPAVLTRILAQAKAPLKDAAAVNTTRWALLARLSALGLPVEVGSGGLTKFNRSTRQLEKTHWLDAACVGTSTPPVLQVEQITPLHIEATGHGTRQMCYLDKHGFPKRHRQRKKVHHGFQTGEMVRAVVPEGKYAGIHVGRLCVRATGTCDLHTSSGKVTVHARHCVSVHKNDGYCYA